MELRCSGTAEPALLLHLQKTTEKLEPCRGGPGDIKRDLREREETKKEGEKGEGARQGEGPRAHGLRAEQLLLMLACERGRGRRLETHGDEVQRDWGGGEIDEETRVH